MSKTSEKKENSAFMKDNPNPKEQKETAAAEEERDGGASAVQVEIEELRQKVTELEEENSQLKDQYLRKQADFENFRKRMFREKEEAIKYANSNLLSDLITIIDDFERAIKAGAEATDVESFRAGIEMIEKQFTGMLERKYGLKRFDSEGEEFDPEKHEAINTEESNEHKTSIVMEDYQKGYLLHDRVLRHAKVKVSVPVTENEIENDKNNGGKE